MITGSSRGIGRAIALKCAADGANIVIASKTSDPHPKLPGTIHTVAQEVEDAGGKALALVLDVRDTDRVAAVIDTAAQHFGGIDALLNNAGAISLTNVESTTMKRVDLMFDINVRAAYCCSAAAIKYLKKSDNGHIINMSPPPSLIPQWFVNHTAYTISKFGMSMCTLGMSQEFKKYGVAVNSLWPKTLIDTVALRLVPGGLDLRKHGRTTDIMADAAHAILTSDSREHTANYYIDEDVLRARGVTDFDHYAVEPGAKLMSDIYVED